MQRWARRCSRRTGEVAGSCQRKHGKQRRSQSVGSTFMKCYAKPESSICTIPILYPDLSSRTGDLTGDLTAPVHPYSNHGHRGPCGGWTDQSRECSKSPLPAFADVKSVHAYGGNRPVPSCISCHSASVMYPNAVSPMPQTQYSKITSAHRGTNRCSPCAR